MTSPQTSMTFPQSAVIVYREYGPTIDFPQNVFTIGPHSVDDYDCGGTFEEQWRLDPETVEGVSLFTDGAPKLSISDTTILTSFKLFVTGSYTYEGETNSTTTELSYKVESLFSAEFLRLSVNENQPTEAYSFDVA